MIFICYADQLAVELISLAERLRLSTEGLPESQKVGDLAGRLRSLASVLDGAAPQYGWHEYAERLEDCEMDLRRLAAKRVHPHPSVVSQQAVRAYEFAGGVLRVYQQVLRGTRHPQQQTIADAVGALVTKSA